MAARTSASVLVSLVLGVLAVGCVAEATGEATDDGPDESTEALTTHDRVSSWVTTHPHDPIARSHDSRFGAPDPSLPAIDVEDGAGHVHQSVEGFGAAMTDAAAGLLHAMPDHGEAVLRRLFDRKRGIGLNFLRVPIAASDSTMHGEYSYEPRPGGPFSIAHDEAYVLPILKRAFEINPTIFTVASPWSPPPWMKECESHDPNGVGKGDWHTCGSMTGGRLKAQYYGAYAEYLAKFVEAYRRHHVPIDAITPQNEPSNASDFPSMSLTERDEERVIDLLSTALHRRGLRTQILGYDWSWKGPTRDESEVNPFLLLANPTTQRELSGLAFHCYWGDPATMTQLRAAYPDKALYVTECDRSVYDDGGTVGSEGIERLITSMRDGAASFAAWQIALHPDGTPNRGHGCRGDKKQPDGSERSWHCEGVVSIGEGERLATLGWDYAYLGHASKFVHRGAHRTDSTTAGSSPVEHVSFVNTNGLRVLVVYNPAQGEERFQVRWGGRAFSAQLGPRSVATFTW